MRNFELRPGLRRLFRIAPRTAVAVRAEMDEELEALISARVEYLVARGLSPDAARAEALRRLGASLDTVRSDLHLSAEHRERRMRFREHVETFIQDLRYAARGLARRPAFTTVAVLTLAIGIGATTAIFSAVNVLLLRPLPFAQPNELMSLTLSAPDNGARKGNDRMVWSYPKYVVLRDAQTVFSSLAVFARTQGSLTSGDVELIRGEQVGATYLRTLGIPTVRGRDFDPSVDAAPGAPKQAILSYALWQRRFNLDPDIVGKTIDIDRQPYAIIGVTPAGFKGMGGMAEVFTSVTSRPAEDLSEPQSHEFSLVARRKPGVTEARAVNEVAVLGRRVGETYQDRFLPGGKWSAVARPIDGGRVSPIIQRSILVLFGAVAFVLLIACVNVANLLLGRANTRRREIAVRLAIGAGRGRLVRLMLTESLLLAAIAGVASVAVAWVGTHALSGVNPSLLQPQRGAALGVVTLSAISIDWVALAFAFGVALVVGVLFGLAPALHATRATLTDDLRDAGGGSMTRRRGYLPSGRGVLVAAEVALALVLLAGSGLMIRSLSKLLSSDVGFDSGQLLTARVTIPPGSVTRDSLPGFYMQLLERLHVVPGVTNVALTDCAPLSGGCNGTIIDLQDRPKVDFAHQPLVGVMWATPDLFSTLRIPLKQGRVFTAADRAGMPKVVVVNETAAHRFWPNESALGKRVGVGQGGFGDGAEVIGVVGDVRQWADSAAKPDVYLPYLQSPSSRMMIFLRTSGDPAALGSSARAAIREVAPQFPVYDMLSMSQRAASATAQARFSAALLAVFAAIALSLAGIGIYGVISLAVTARTREIGIRIALGADRGRVQRLVVGEGVGLVAVGAVVGVGGALMSTRVLRSLLFEVSPFDPATYVAIVALLGGVAVLASWLPARRAARVDPLAALRAE